MGTPSHFKVAATPRYCLKTPGQLTSVVCIYITFFRMHERDIATEREFNTVLQMTLEHVLTQKFKESTKWTEKIANISKHV